MKCFLFLGVLLCKIAFYLVFLISFGCSFDTSAEVRKEKYRLNRKYDNVRYRMKKDFFASNNEPKRIVMLGNSLTEGMDWNKLLDRNDIANRGISGDITEGMLARIDQIVELKPEICFVMGGINDLACGIPSNEILNNLSLICSELSNNRINIVLQSLLLVGEIYPDYLTLNARIVDLNLQIEKLAKEFDYTFINLNASLSNGFCLNNDFTYDGIHLTDKAYHIWGEEILRLIPQSEEVYNDN